MNTKKLAGVVNAHSHAFQRALRGIVEKRPESSIRDDFWSWRSVMYSLANTISAEEIEILTTWAYADMLKAGFTSVGEFHYIHHGPHGEAWPSSVDSIHAIIRAAQAVGIRLVVMPVAYQRAGYQKDLLPEQKRFVFAHHDDFLRFADDCRAVVENNHHPSISFGLAAHSVRACDRDWLSAVSSYAQKYKLPLHIHACEQPAEITACLQEHQQKPIPYLDDIGFLDQNTVLVHATHIDLTDIEILQKQRAQVCICPTTERNLGDGLCPIQDLYDADVSLSVGTDSHATIDICDELSALENHERLRTGRRHVLQRAGQTLADALWPIGVQGGWRALGLSAESCVGDFIHAQMPWEYPADDAGAMDAWLIGGNSNSVTDVWVDHEHIVKDGQLTRLDETALQHAVKAVLQRHRRAR